MNSTGPHRIRTIAEFHQLRELPKPKHPLISVVHFDGLKKRQGKGTEHLLFDFYTLSLKRGMNHTYTYGQKTYQYDFNDGVMFFMAPNQVFSVQFDEDTQGPSGWMILIHPDFLWNTSLAPAIKKYAFFDYSVNEALFLSEAEEQKIVQIIHIIDAEYQDRIDAFSQSIIISQLETLLHYSDRFYQRQFVTRQKVNHEILERLEIVLNDYINSGKLMLQGLPSVQFIAENLHVSPGYLRALLKQLTGQSTQQLIHDKLIEKAKEILSTTQLSVSQIAYELGLEQPQSFSRLFKSKTQQSPLAFREQFT